MTTEEIKALRVEVDALIQKANKLDIEVAPEHYGQFVRMPREKVFEHLTEAKMWLGKCLEQMGNKLPAEFADKSTNETN